MAKVFRIFVEKKRGNDIEAGQTLADLRDNVGLNALDDLRIINRYYAQGLTEEEFDLAVKQILSEPNLDNVYTELSIPEDYRYFATEFLPGQYDQRADSAAQCIQLLTAGERPVVQYAKIIAVKGDITDDEFEKIKNYIINPVESRVASLEIPESLDIKSSIPADIARIDGFIEMSDEEIKAYHASMGFAMSIADLCWVRDYFKNDEGRNPSLTELKVIDTYWSDHCRHTTFATELDEIKIDSGKYTEAINKALEQYFDNLNSICEQIVKQERAYREELIKYEDFEDKIFRAMGTLKMARKLTAKEFYSLISLVRLGISMGSFNEKYETVSRLLHDVGTATIMSESDEGLTVDDTEKIRAQYVRESLA